ncbi:Hsp20/alpha crystallin family protein [Oceaniglobus roseus]|uniref:Hsp20/alpha crystallin family protein n=1 Tax=Oceaniglobus roseus TaxID=1737570 RepID=UPI000C7EC34B|nr:Hsp20/alpha crystallin family protein [Kandeliimicrobium roseum]
MSKKTHVPVTRGAERFPQSALSGWPGFGSLRDEMERLFDAFEPTRLFERGSPGTPAMFAPAALSPAMDVVENDKSFSIAAELPGMEAKDVSVKISDGMLTISGEKTEESSREQDAYHVSERRWGSFRRSIRLPQNIDQEKIDAQFAKGVLTISLPKSEAALAAEKTIEVHAA